MLPLADQLQTFAAKPVIDKTGFAGKYDLSLQHELNFGPQSPALSDPEEPSEPTGASLFTAAEPN
jgi:uncharacterized protein (TIGR03435 family)